MIVDTGCSLVRDAWIEQTFLVVDPDDVRWVFLSHDCSSRRPDREALRRTLDLAGTPIPPTPGQDTLDQLIATILAKVA